MLPRTQRQKEILDYITRFLERHGYVPSYAQIARHFGVKSRATIAKHIAALERRGLIVREHEDGSFALNVKVEETTSDALCEVRLLGRCGRPTSARRGCAAPRRREDSRFERATLRTPASPSRVSTSSHERSSGPRQTSLIGSFLPSAPGAERLGEGADDGRDAHRGLPAVVVPPDAVAGVELALARALGGLDAVDVVEPVDAAAVLAPAGDAVDLLHEVAAEARLDVERALQQPHHRLALARLSARLVGASRVSPKSCETVTVTDPPDWTSAAPKPQPARRAAARSEDGGALHRTVNTTRVVPRCERRAVARAVDRDRVEHVAALARARAGSR